MPGRILIIEDDQAISQMYRIKFQAEGYTVETAENGKLGLDLAESMKPDIILLDLMMPEMNGDEMLDKLRKTTWGKDMKIVILTNVGEAEVAERVIKMDISGFIVKAQFTPAEVVGKVKQILELP